MYYELGGDSALWSIAARFPAVGNPDFLKLSELRFWLEGCKQLKKVESN